MDGADWLRTQLSSFGCAACGQAYEASRIRVLAERDGLYFVDLGCAHCGTQAVAIVTVQLDDEENAQGTRDDQRPTADTPAVEAVSADDVLTVHRLLEGYEGDLDGLLDLLGRGGPSEAR